jgi:CBS domain containing-hemolysin-like protein
MDTEHLLIILLSLSLSAFFSGMEIAFVASNKLHLELMKKRGGINARILTPFLKNPTRFIATMLVGNNIALVLYGITMAKVLGPIIIQFSHSEIVGLLIQTICSASIVLVTAEFLPKVFFAMNANRFIRLFAFPAWLSYHLLYFVVVVVVGVSNIILKHFMRVRHLDQKPAFARTDLEQYLQEHTNTRENPDDIDTEIKIFQNALDFSRVKARECMVPRTEIQAIHIHEDIENLRDIFVRTGFSKIPVFKENIDQVIGFVHSCELFKSPEDIKSILLPISMVPETMTANEILKLFIQERKSIVLVVDEFGGTSGILTVEDILEEIFGEIEDEHDILELEEVKISEEEFIFSGRHEVDYLNEKYQLSLPESNDYETLSGLIVKHCECIPELKARIELNDFVFHIIEVEQTKIEKVQLFKQT